MLYRAPRGTRDILPEEAARWFYIESLFRVLCSRYGFGEIRTPLFEQTALFARSVGEESDIVSKEMYSFKDRGGRDLTLRPEGTAPVVRAYLEHGLASRPQPVKLFYHGPMFRYDRPQAGRYRQFHQFGLEIFGAAGPAADYEVIAMTWEYITVSLGITEVDLELNSVGCPGCRLPYRAALLAYMETRRAHLCPDCNRRLDVNPLRVLDCKETGCRAAAREAPQLTAMLCPDCAAHFEALQQLLHRCGPPFRINPFLVRGLDYYTRTAFEVVSRAEEGRGSLGGGGRYDYLVEQCGGPATPAVGVALGFERLALAAPAGQTDPASVFAGAPAAAGPVALPGCTAGPGIPVPIFVAYTGADLAGEAQILAARIRARGYAVETELAGRGLKGQMKFAGRKGFRIVIILGEKEYGRGKLILRDMAGRGQEEIASEQLFGHLETLSCCNGSGGS